MTSPKHPTEKLREATRGSRIDSESRGNAEVASTLPKRPERPPGDPTTESGSGVQGAEPLGRFGMAMKNRGGVNLYLGYVYEIYIPCKGRGGPAKKSVTLPDLFCSQVVKPHFGPPRKSVTLSVTLAL